MENLSSQPKIMKECVRYYLNNKLSIIVNDLNSEKNPKPNL